MNGTERTEKKEKYFIDRAKDEQGSVLVISMLILVMLTVLGFASMNTANVEKLVAGNERTYKENFFRAEAANMVGGQRFVNLTDPTEAPGGMDYGSAGPGVSGEVETALKGGEDWISSVSLPDEPFDISISGSALDNNSRYHVLYIGDVTGNSQGLSNPSNFHVYSVYGLSDIKRGNVIIQTSGAVSF